MRRFGDVTVKEATSAVLIVMARVYTVGFTVYFAGSKFLPIPSATWAWFLIYVVSAFYAAIVPLLPKKPSQKWIAEEQKRAEMVGVALSKLSIGIVSRNLRTAEFKDIVTGLLQAMKSEVQAIAGDKEGIYTNVTLLIHDCELDKLRVLSRADLNRPEAVYERKALHVAESLKDGRRRYFPKLDLQDKPYCCILGVPLLSQLPSGLESIGVISIDSSEPHYFDSRDQKIEAKLQPYIAMLKLAILFEKEFGEGRRNGRNRNKR
jgi:hypothetical protein